MSIKTINIISSDQTTSDYIAITSSYEIVEGAPIDYYGRVNGISYYVDLSVIPKNSKITSVKLKHSRINKATGGIAEALGVTLNTDSLDERNTEHDVTEAFEDLSTFPNSFKVSYYWQARVVDTSAGTHYVNLRCYNPQLEITYTPPSSTGKMSATSVTAGGSATLTISANSSAYTHFAEWYIGNTKVATDTVAAGVKTVTRSFPLSYCQYCTTGTKTTGKVVLTTKNGSTVLGSNEYSYTFKVPSSVKPAITSISLIDTVSKGSYSTSTFLQTLSKIRITVVVDTSNEYGGSITSVTVTGNGETLTTETASSSTSSSATYVLTCKNVMSGSGAQAFNVTVSDSRGKSVTSSESASVYAYKTPYLSSISVYRCLSSGSNPGAANELGTNVAAKATFKYSTTSGLNNTATVTSAIAKVQNGSTGSYTNGNNLATSGTAFLVNKTVDSLSADNIYSVKLTITDKTNKSTTYTYTVPSAQYLMHWSKDALENGSLGSIGIGRAADANPGTSKGKLSIATNWDTEMGELETTRMNVVPESGHPTIRMYDPAFPDDSPICVIYAARNGSSAAAVGRIYIRATYPGETYGENYRLPQPATGLSEHESYNILTSKAAVTVAQGGTGQTTTAGVKSAFGIPTFSLSGTTLTITPPS